VTSDGKEVQLEPGAELDLKADYVIQPEPVFPEPASLLTPAPRLPGTDGRKMSKSYGNAILLTDPEPVVRLKLKTMVTDPARVRRTDPGNPDVCPVGDLHKIFSSKETMAKVYEGCRSAGIGCIECKSWAADAIVKIINPMQERRKKYEDNPRLAWDILEAGSARAREIAGATMNDVRAAMGLDYSQSDSQKDSQNDQPTKSSTR
jgi:tryptophanyl-tRNA synthetase